MRRLTISVVLLLAVGALSAEEPALGTLIHEAWAACNSPEAEQQTDGLSRCRDLLGREDLTPEQRADVYRFMVEAYTRHVQRYEEALAVCREMWTDLADVPALRHSAEIRVADIYWRWPDHDAEAIAELQAYAAKEADQPAYAAQVLLRKAWFHERQKEWEEAYAAAAAAKDAVPDDYKTGSEALSRMQGAVGQLRDHERRLKILLEILNPPYFEVLNEWTVEGRRGDLFYVWRELGRHEELRAYFASAEAEEKDPRRGQRYCLMQAESFQEEKLYDDALATLNRVFIDYPATRDYWQHAQERTADILREKGDFEGSVRHARLLLDTARDDNGFASACHRIINALLEFDDDPRRSNRFLAFQTWGPNGEDGEPGTDDDLTREALDSIPYPDLSDRRVAFDRVEPDLGDDAEAFRQRGYAYLFSGRPDRALTTFVDALRRVHPYRAADVAWECTMSGLRSVRGYPQGIRDSVDYILYGPVGPDGAAGTADDLTDPFAGETAKLGTLGTVEEEKIRRLSAYLEDVVRDTSDLGGVRNTAAEALSRLHETLPTWSDETGPMTLRSVFETDRGDHVRSLLRLGQHAAKGGDCHLGGVRAYWQELSRLEETLGKSPDEGVRNGEYEAFRRCMENLERPLKTDPRRQPEKEIPADVRLTSPVSEEGLRPGLAYAYYEGQFEGSMPDFAGLTPRETGVADELKAGYGRRRDNAGLLFSGYIRLDRCGPYRFFLRSSDGSRLFIGEHLIVDNDGDHDNDERSGTVDLPAGVYPLTVEFYSRGGGAALDLQYERFRMGRRRVPKEAYLHREP